jgi:hypothetical protein
MSRNPNHGIAGKTPTRPATHSPNLQSGNMRCLACGSRHVLVAQSTNGRRLGSHWCGGCGRFWTPRDPAIDAYNALVAGDRRYPPIP